MERVIFCGSDFCSVCEDGMLVEYLQQDQESQAGDVLVGTVERIMKTPDCAFVDIGRKHAGFLPLKENSRSFTGIPLRSGMKIAVQIRKEETGNKGACLTRDITVPGALILLMPFNRYIGVSSRISDEQCRNRLRTEGQNITEGKAGIVMREASVRSDHAEIAEEYRRLSDIWESIEIKFRNSTGNGTVLYHADPVAQMIRDYENKGPLTIKQVESMPSDQERQLRISGQRTVRTVNGGNIVIDRCEAMTVIDVNTGSAMPAGGESGLFLETNLSACETIAEQIRLRDLGGIIIIDFIDMDSDAQRSRVYEHFQEILKRDRRKTVIHGWTKLGLLEMTRKRTGKG